jgi:hypothetical protein
MNMEITGQPRVPAARVINTWPAAQLLEWAKAKSAPGRRAA